MNGKTLRDKLVGSDQERAVSPVIGVILMVAITVILAAVIATLVMDFGQNTESPINAQVDTEVDGDGVTIETVQAGSADGFILRGPGVPGEVAISGDYGTETPGYGINDNPSGAAGWADSSDNLSASTGDMIKITSSSDALYDGSSAQDWGEGTVNVIAVDGDQTEKAGEFEVPSSWP